MVLAFSDTGCHVDVDVTWLQTSWLGKNLFEDLHISWGFE